MTVLHLPVSMRCLIEASPHVHDVDFRGSSFRLACLMTGNALRIPTVSHVMTPRSARHDCIFSLKCSVASNTNHCTMRYAEAFPRFGEVFPRCQVQNDQAFPRLRLNVNAFPLLCQNALSYSCCDSSHGYSSRILSEDHKPCRERLDGIEPRA